MREKCETIDAKIKRCRRLWADVDDQTAIVLLDLVIADLEAEKFRLQSSENRREADHV